MRELTFLETGCLAGLLLLSAVLPLLLSIRNPINVATKKTCLRIVWVGQGLGTLAALTVLASARFAPYAASFGLANCVWCALALLRQFRADRKV